MTSKHDRGAAAVEAALVLPLLLMLIFGIIEFGLLLTAQINVSQAAREAARAATVDPDPSAARDRVRRIDSDFDIVAGESNGCRAHPAPGDDAVIVVSYEYSFVTPLGGFVAIIGGGSWGDSIDVYGTGVMPCRA
jgi:Flp pilus assembly protein TadG